MTIKLIEHDGSPRDPEHRAAVDVLLVLADAQARWGDYREAVALLDAATEIAVEIPAEHAAKRARWQLLADVAERHPLSLSA